MTTGRGETCGATWELRGNRLYANGEPQTVGRLTVIVALARYRRERGAGIELPQDGGAVEIPAELARFILSLEQKLALAQLAAEIADRTAA